MPESVVYLFIIKRNTNTLAVCYIEHRCYNIMPRNLNCDFQTEYDQIAHKYFL